MSFKLVIWNNTSASTPEKNLSTAVSAASMVYIDHLFLVAILNYTTSFDTVRATTEWQAIAWALVFSSIPDLFLRPALLDHPLRLANGDPLSENTDLLTRNCNILIDVATVEDVGGIWLLFCFIASIHHTSWLYLGRMNLCNRKDKIHVLCKAVAQPYWDGRTMFMVFKEPFAPWLHPLHTLLSPKWAVCLLLCTGPADLKMEMARPKMGMMKSLICHRPPPTALLGSS